jgi:cytochrome d ubiquinol oxidase subunit I
VAASLLAFIVVYFFVFGAGTFYILRMMNAPTNKPDPDLKDGPIRTVGITPIIQIDPDSIPANKDPYDV